MATINPAGSNIWADNQTYHSTMICHEDVQQCATEPKNLTLMGGSSTNHHPFSVYAPPSSKPARTTVLNGIQSTSVVTPTVTSDRTLTSDSSAVVQCEHNIKYCQSVVQQMNYNNVNVYQCQQTTQSNSNVDNKLDVNIEQLSINDDQIKRDMMSQQQGYYDTTSIRGTTNCTISIAGSNLTKSTNPSTGTSLCHPSQPYVTNTNTSIKSPINKNATTPQINLTSMVSQLYQQPYTDVEYVYPPNLRILSHTQSLDLVEEHHEGDDDDDGDDDEYRSVASVIKHHPTLRVNPSGVRARSVPKTGSLDQGRRISTRTNPNSPYGSPLGSPRLVRRPTPLRESRRVSVEQNDNFLQLNQYKLFQKIGQGSFGHVKLAISSEDMKEYAMKILCKKKLVRMGGLMGRGPKRTTATSPLDRVYHEIAVLKKLDHPNIVKLIEVLDDPDNDSLYLAFELVKNGEVLHIPTSKPFNETRAWSVFRDALQGLEYLHYQKICHGDIKPSNLLLAECGHVKIADFGVCSEFDGEDTSMVHSSAVGTPAFRAPETLISGQNSYCGKAADIWALGATLYALVYGNVPFSGPNVFAVYEKIKHDTLILPAHPKVSDALKDLIYRMLEKNPDERILLAAIKEHPWVTRDNTSPMLSEDENCRFIPISDEEVNSAVTSIPKLDTLILIKTMMKKRSFKHPYQEEGALHAPRLKRSARSYSEPGVYHSSPDRQLSGDNHLPSVSETVPGCGGTEPTELQ